MTTTDETTTTDDDESNRPEWLDGEVRRGDPDPCPAFDGCNTDESVNDRFREGWAFAVIVYGDRFRVAPWFARQWGEELRRAHVRTVAVRDGRRRGAVVARERVQSVARPTEHGDGSLSIMCAGPCGAEKPVNKFPTMKGGGRGTVCRECAAAIRAERKAAK